MHRKILATLAFIMVISVSFAQDKRALFFLDQGQKEFKLRNYPQALNYFEKYFQKDSSSQVAYMRVAQIYESFRNTKTAEEYYKKTIAFDTDTVQFPQAYAYLGTRALEKNDFASAQRHLSVALKYARKDSKIYQQLTEQLKRCEFGINAMSNSLDIKPERLPDIINSKNKQYFPVLTADNSTLVFTVLDENDNENLYISKFEGNAWTPPTGFSNNINTLDNEGTSSISADGKTMVFTSCGRELAFGNCDLYITRNEGGVWSKPENLGPQVNSPDWDSQPSLSPDGRKLIFSSERPNGFGKKDLWMSELRDDGKWQPAINLGSKINTPSDEVTPFIHANGSSLFYSSNGKIGMGNLDVYITDISIGFGSESVNLGYPINTKDDESGLFISADGSTAYYSVDKNGKVEIYKFEVPKEISTKFDKTYYVKGYIIDGKTNLPLYASVEIVSIKTGARVSKFYSDRVKGDYMAVLPEDGKYRIYLESPGYFFKSVEFDFVKESGNKNMDISLNRIEKESKEELKNIFFDTGSALLRPESEIELERLTEMLRHNANLQIEIAGHTDDVGNETSNLDLSKKRAGAVVTHLQKKGIPENRMTAKGYGKSQPKVANTTEQNRQQNRRIEIKIL